MARAPERVQRPARLPRRAVDGVLLLDKPEGLTSNAALQRAKRALRAEKAGHTGTLDPAATGLIALCFGEATKFSATLLDADKVYLAVVQLGVTTRTGDREGEVLERREVRVGQEAVEQALARFRGRILQTPPMHSAIKLAGTPLYAYARKGQEVERAPREVVVHALDLERIEGDLLYLSIHCGKGTYVRTLAEDIGRALGCGAHLAGMRRTAVGAFSLDRALPLERLEAMTEDERLDCLLPVDALVAHLPGLVLGNPQARRMRHGQQVLTEAEREPGLVRLYDEAGCFLGLGEVTNGGVINAKRLVAEGPGAEASP
ncbi:MAG TPA: tRNA pseudouridine(55) synthase TruB [Burkholderiales bacterium]|nr:tRNA pseudouridine(55) synthase TruB [Burkholderiales bacterium]